MKQGRKIFWGLVFILGALALIIGQMGYFGEFSFWSAFVSIALFGILVDGIWNRNYGTVLFSSAFLVIVNDTFLGLEAITPWPVLCAALLGTIGLHILFPGKKRKYFNEFTGKIKMDDHNMEGENILTGEEISFSNSFGESVKYLSGNEISKVDLKNSFGELQVYFDNAALANGVAYVYVENAFGEMVLYVPSDWKVIMNMETVFAGAEEKGRCNPTGNNTLHLYGKLSFGEFQIRYL